MFGVQRKALVPFHFIVSALRSVRMKKSETISLVSLAVGAGAGAGLYYLLPDLHWLAYVLIGLAVAGGLYKGMMEQEATRVVVDREFDKR
jgi:uncharacterized membrane protein YfcA